MKKLPEVDITIVNYNGGQTILNCLECISILKDKLKFNVWVVDNASIDGSVEEIKRQFDQVNLILNQENVGFGKAQNQALRESRGDYVLILNPDTIVKDGVIEHLVDYLEQHLEVGAISPKIVFQSGEVDLTAHRGFPTPEAAFKYYILKDDSLYHLRNRISSKPHEVDAIAGAFFLMPRAVLDKVGYFDEDYFMYAEDIDLCLRIKQHGYRIIYDPEVTVLHLKGVLSGIKKHSQAISKTDKSSKKRALDSFYRTMWIFYQKHYSNTYPFWVSWLVWLGIQYKWMTARWRMVV